MKTIQFKNISQFEQLGVEPGKTGEAKVTQDEVDRLVERGAIELADGTQTTGSAGTPQESKKPQETGEPQAGQSRPGRS